MLRVVCWLWQPREDYRSKFNAGHVEILYNMVERNYRKPFEMVCITDRPSDIDHRVRAVPLWDTFAGLVSPHGERQPACYRRLRAFSPEMAEVIGPRFVSVDLDAVIVGDVTDLWDREEDFIIWGSQLRNTPYNGSMWMMDAGARKQVYEQFHPKISPTLARRAGHQGSDQAWFTYILGPNEAMWTPDDGVLAWRTDLKRRNFELPDHAKIVFFQGHTDPWDQEAQQREWVREHYR